MKALIVFFVSAVLFVSCCYSQQPVPTNAVYVEILGNGLAYSLNYENFINTQISCRAGLAYIPIFSTMVDVFTPQSTAMLVFPLTLNYFTNLDINDINSPHKLELGLGIDIIKFIGDDNFEGAGVFSKFSKSGLGVVGTATIGYRYLPITKGFIFGVGFTPLFTTAEFQLFGGFNFGYIF
jgi:hypothetical protein